MLCVKTGIGWSVIFKMGGEEGWFLKNYFF